VMLLIKRTQVDCVELEYKRYVQRRGHFILSFEVLNLRCLMIYKPFSELLNCRILSHITIRF
jgi:hypothetical protein